MHETKPHLDGQMIRLIVVLIAAFTLSGCRSCASKPTNTNSDPNTNAIAAQPSPTAGEHPTETPTPVTPTPSPSPNVVAKSERIKAWASKLDDDAWIDRDKRLDISTAPGEDPLNRGDRVNTNQKGQASLRFICGTMFLFHDTGLTTSPCPRSSNKSGSCFRGGAVSMDVNRRACGQELVLGTESVEIKLANVNAAHSAYRTTQPIPAGGSSPYPVMKSIFQNDKGAHIVAHHFPKQKATVIQVRSIKQGMVEVRPVTKEGNRKQVRQLGEPIFLVEGECVVSQPGLVKGLDIRGVPQRSPVACDKNLWPLLVELSQRENVTPITTENAILITDIALKRGEVVPDSERGPVISVSPDVLNFAVQAVGGDSIDRTILIENRGKPPLRVDEPTFGGANDSDFKILLNTCDKPVESRCEIELEFAPRGIGIRQAKLRIPNNGANQPTEISLIGSGKAPNTIVKLEIDADTQFTFFPIQKVGTTAKRPVSVKNTGQVPIKIDKVSIEGDGKDAFVSQNQCSKPIVPNESCNVEVTFAPKTAEGFKANLSITATEVTSFDIVPRSVVAGGAEVKGTGGEPAIKIDQSELCFDKHKALKKTDPKVRQELSLTISNSGQVPLTISNMAVSNDDFKIVRENCTANDLAALSGECRVVVGFTPRGSRLRESTLTINHDDRMDNPTKVSLKGIGKHRNIFKRAYEGIFKRTNDRCK
jgi:hypothetical protein